MDSNTYQQLAWDTAKPFYKNDNSGSDTFKILQITTACLALCGEAGELGNKLKKIVEAGGGIDHNALDILQEELGDVQWYIAHMASLLNIRLESVMGQNVSKLRERYKDQLKHRAIAQGGF